MASERERISSLHGDEKDLALREFSRAKGELNSLLSSDSSPFEGLGVETPTSLELRKFVTLFFDNKEALEDSKKELAELKAELSKKETGSVPVGSARNPSFNDWDKDQVFTPLPSLPSLSDAAKVALDCFRPELQTESGLLETLWILDQFALTQVPPDSQVEMWRQILPPQIIDSPASSSGSLNSQANRLVEVPTSADFPSFLSHMGGPAVFAECKGALNPGILISFESFLAKKISGSQLSKAAVLLYTADNFASSTGISVYQGRTPQLLNQASTTPLFKRRETSLDFSAKAPKMVVANVTSSSKLSRLAALPPSQSSLINSIYGKTGGFPEDVVHAFRNVAHLGAARIRSGKSAFNTEFVQEATVAHRNQLVLLACVELLCQGLSEHGGALWAGNIADSWTRGDNPLANDAEDPGMPTPLSEALRQRDLDLNLGQRAFSALKRSSETHSPTFTVSLLRDFFSLEYSGQGALQFATEFVNVFHKTSESIVPPPGVRSHGAMGEAECLDLVVRHLVDGYPFLKNWIHCSKTW
jgi:hypothetical protein